MINRSESGGFSRDAGCNISVREDKMIQSGSFSFNAGGHYGMREETFQLKSIKCECFGHLLSM